MKSTFLPFPNQDVIIHRFAYIFPKKPFFICDVNDLRKSKRMS